MMKSSCDICEELEVILDSPKELLNQYMGEVVYSRNNLYSSVYQKKYLKEKKCCHDLIESNEKQKNGYRPN